MSDDSAQLNIVSTLSSIATLKLHGPGDIAVFMIVESELNQLGEQSAEARDASAFFFGCAGALVSGVLSAIASQPSGLLAVGYYVIIFVLCVFTLWFGIKWRSAQRKHSALLTEIRKRPSISSAGMFSDRARPGNA